MGTEIVCLLPLYTEASIQKEIYHSTLQFLLKRASFFRNDQDNPKPWLSQEFGISKQYKLPVAALTGLADGLPTMQDYWMRADPIRLHASWSGLSSQLLSPKDINMADLQSVLTKLKKFLRTYDIVLYTPHTIRWYFKMNKMPHIKTTPLETIQGNFISHEQWLHDLMLENKVNTLVWTQIFTGIQMLLHEAHLPFNTLWFWGEGSMKQFECEDFIEKTSSFDTIWTNEPLLKGLAKLGKLNACDLSHENIMYLDAMLNTKKHFMSLEALKSSLMVVLLKKFITCLYRFKIRKLTMYDTQGNQYQLTPYTIRRFWRY